MAQAGRVSTGPGDPDEADGGPTAPVEGADTGVATAERRSLVSTGGATSFGDTRR